MKQLILTAGILAAAMTGAAAHAADNRAMLPIAGALAVNDAQARLDGSVKFYFEGQPTPAVVEILASDKTSQKTNALGKSTEKACNWVFLSAMLRLQQRAQQLGANSVINIVSNYNNVPNASATEFECHVGTIMAGVAFKADFVKVAAE
jgi:uncharacterized protein YbjQ (UPF0145 family)